MSHSQASLLVIDDERSVCHSCQVILRDAGYQVECEMSGLLGAERAAAGAYDLILLDLKMPDLSGMEALERIMRARPDALVVIITGYATIQTSIEAIKKGAYDYVPKPFTPDELTMTVQKALAANAVARENKALKAELKRLRKSERFLGRSRLAEALKKEIQKVAPSDFTVTIYGESGTGKEVVARELHERSHRAEGPFVAVDVSALTASLIESELFGHVRGAFTGAARKRPGHFLSATGGTLFLDEIANICLETQGKLLRALETRCIRPVGGDDEVAVDVRLVTATNRNLFALVESGEFREDLYYRLNVIPLRIPPLRDRSDDVPLLATHFLKEGASRTETPLTGFSTEAMAKLIAYPWPGNVRELRNIVERMLATVDERVVRVEHLPPEIRGEIPFGDDLVGESTPMTIDELKAEKRRVKELVYARLERSFVLAALERSGWNVTRAAASAGIARPNLHALMRKHGIRRDEPSDGG